MKQVAKLVRRNLAVFFRDRLGVAMSLLSPAILFLLYALFLGNQQSEALMERFPDASAEAVGDFVNAWVFSGIIMMTTVTTGLQAMNTFVGDRVNNRFKDFLIAPVSRIQLVAGYLIAALVVAFAVSVSVFAVGQTYLFLTGQSSLTLEDIGTSIAFIALSCFSFAALTAFLTTFITSNSGFSALATVVGTVVGFLAGAYVPMGVLPDSVASVISALPFAFSAMVLRGPLTAVVLDTLTAGSSQAAEALSEFYGITLTVGSYSPSTVVAVVAMIATAVFFLFASALFLRRRIS